MKAFMDKDFLLETETAKQLYFDFAADLPIIDYHCHISPKEIYEDKHFSSLDEVWLGGRNADGSVSGDHYKWRVMRSNGVPEDYITGNKPSIERIREFAGALEMAIGNPMYHWCHLELKKYFGITKPLSKATADEIFDACNKKLSEDSSMSARGLIKQSKVEFIGTTDDPTDTLEWHKKIADDPTVDFKVCPSFRPDKAINITKPGFGEHINKLAESVGKTALTSFDEVCAALKERLEAFKALGCTAGDHGLDYVMYREGTEEEADSAFKKAMSGQALTLEEAEKYQTALLLFLAKQYAKLGIVMQLHYSCLRNTNTKRFEELGADSGFDMIAQNSCGRNIVKLLNKLSYTAECPKTIIYSLNPADNAQIASLLGCFQTEEIAGKIQMGSAWWFNDTKSGMEAQLESLANMGLLGNFIGMLTDSRSFLSYTRHDYFRRILCNFIGNLVEKGEFPNDKTLLKRIVEGICYYNAKRYFGI